MQDGVQGAEARPARRDRLAREQRMGALEHRGDGRWVSRSNGQPATPEQLAALRQDLPHSAQGTGALRGEALDRYRAWVTDPANPPLDPQAWYRNVEQPRVRATANMPSSTDRHLPASTPGTGQAEVASARAAATETGNAHPPAAAEGREAATLTTTQTVEGYTRDQRPVHRDARGRAVTEDGNPVTETWFRSHDRAAVHTDGAVTPQRRGPDASTEPMAGGGASVAERHLDAARRQRSEEPQTGSRTAAVPAPDVAPEVRNRLQDARNRYRRDISITDQGEHSAHQTAVDVQSSNATPVPRGNIGNVRQRPLLAGETVASVRNGQSVAVGQGTATQVEGMRPGQVVGTTGLQGCSGVAIEARRPDGTTVRSVMHIEAESRHGQSAEVAAEVANLSRQGCRDFRVVATVNGPGEYVPSEANTGARDIPRTPEAFSSEIRRRLETDHGIALASIGDLNAHIDVAGDANTSAMRPANRAMYMNDEGVLVQEESGASRAVPWNAVNGRNR